MKNILVIDDDPVAQEFLNFTLKKQGHSVTISRSPEEALRCCQQAEFDLVICDMVMPCENASINPGTAGLVAISAINRKFPALPVILVSSFTPDMPFPSLEKLGVISVIAKPFRKHEIIEEVNQHSGD